MSDMTARAFKIADEAMTELLMCHGVPDEALIHGSHGSVGLVDQNSHEVATLDEADPAIREAFEWLRDRGLAELVTCGTGGEVIFLKVEQ